jgi:hypothetical protein
MDAPQTAEGALYQHPSNAEGVKYRGIAAVMPAAPCPLRQSPRPKLAPACHPTWLVNSKRSNGVDNAMLLLGQKLVTLFWEWAPKEPYAGFGTRPKTSGR